MTFKYLVSRIILSWSLSLATSLSTNDESYLLTSTHDNYSIECQKTRLMFKKNRPHLFIDSFLDCLNSQSLNKKQQHVLAHMLFRVFPYISDSPQSLAAYNKISNALQKVLSKNIKSLFLDREKKQFLKTAKSKKTLRELSQQTITTDKYMEKTYYPNTSTRRSTTGILVLYELPNVNKNPRYFQVDTGATSTIFNHEQTKNNEKLYDQNYSTFTSSENFKAPYGLIKEIKLFGRSVSDFPALFLSTVDQHSLLGIDFLLHFNNLCIRPQKLILNSESCHKSIVHWHPIELSLPLKLVTTISIDSAKHKVLLDTGSFATIFKSDIISPDSISYQKRKSVFGGSNTNTKVTIESAMVGLTFRNQSFQSHVLEETSNNLNIGSDVDGILGLEFFDSFETVVFDFKNMQLGLGKRKSDPSYFNKRH